MTQPEPLAAETSDQEVGALAELPVAVVADVLDRLGLRNQVMHHDLRPRTTEHSASGRAYPIQAELCSAIVENPYERELEAVDAVPAGAVVVVATGDSRDVAVWGELLATAATRRGAVGAVVEGGVRDLTGLRSLGLPTFSTSVSANDSRGRLEVVGHGSAVPCGGVEVAPGDIVRTDLDGVVVVPAGHVGEVLRMATEKRSKELASRELLASGMPAAQVYSRHGVL